MPRIIESTFEYALPRNCKLRVWRTEQELGLQVHTDIKTLADKYETFKSAAQFVDVICSLPRVSAVQFINAHGNGFVAYTEWP